MGMEEFFTVLSDICLKILPVVGVVLFIYLVVLVHRLLQVLGSVHKAVDSANQTIHEVEIQVRKLDGPLQTATEISDSVSKVHQMSEHAIKTIALMMVENFSAIKEYLNSFLHKEDPKDEDVEKEEILQEEK